MVFMLRWGGLTKVSRNSLGIYISIREFATLAVKDNMEDLIFQWFFAYLVILLLGLLRGSWSLEQIVVRTKGKREGL